jgi:hypothetical protein
MPIVVPLVEVARPMIPLPLVLSASPVKPTVVPVVDSARPYSPIPLTLLVSPISP